LGQLANDDPCELYELQELIGTGSVGKVFRATRKHDRKEVALKFSTVATTWEGEAMFLQDEFEILRGLTHPHIVQALDLFHHASGSVLVLSYHPGSTLDVAVRECEYGRFPEETAQTLFGQLMKAIAYMHESRVLHRDVKAPNIIVSPDKSILHLADFNVAKALSFGPSLTPTGTRDYAAPEVLQGESPSEAHDVWGAGLCLFMMMTGRLPKRLSAYHSMQSFENAVQCEPVTFHAKHWEGISVYCKAVVRQCLQLDKRYRPSAMRVLQAEWLVPRPRQTEGAVSQGRRSSERSAACLSSPWPSRRCSESDVPFLLNCVLAS